MWCWGGDYYGLPPGPSRGRRATGVARPPAYRLHIAYVSLCHAVASRHSYRVVELAQRVRLPPRCRHPPALHTCHGGRGRGEGRGKGGATPPPPPPPPPPWPSPASCPPLGGGGAPRFRYPVRPDRGSRGEPERFNGHRAPQGVRRAGLNEEVETSFEMGLSLAKESARDKGPAQGSHGGHIPNAQEAAEILSAKGTVLHVL